MKPRKTYGVLSKDKRPSNISWSATKVRHRSSLEDEHMGDEAEQRKKIKPVILEDYNKSKDKK